MKKALAPFLHSLGLVFRKLKRGHGNDFLIMMYHRVIPSQDMHKGSQAGIYIEPETFELHVRFLMKHFKVVPLAELLSHSSKRTNKQGRHVPLCAVTFDDGWRDFYEYAFPILKKYQVPAGVFLPTDFIGTRRWFWTDRLGYLIFRNNLEKKRVEMDFHSSHPLVGKILMLEGSYEVRLEKAIEILKVVRGEEIQTVLTELAQMGIADSVPPERSFLLWEEVGKMAQSGLISFGSHTAAHEILTTLTDEEVREELFKSKEKLIAEGAVDPSYISFSYPNGSHDKRIIQLVKDAGYSVAVTTQRGWNRPEAEPFTLRRVGVHQDIASTGSMLGCRIEGIF